MNENIEKGNEKNPKFGQIMGINVTSTSIGQVLTGVEEKVSRSMRFSIVTPNPELVLMAQNNSELKEALNSADFAVPDGVGLSYAYRFLYGKTLNVIPGRKLFDELIKLVAQKHWKVFLLGGINNEASLATEKLKIDNSLKTENWNLKIESCQGPKLDRNGEPVTKGDIKLQQDAIDKINKFSPQILFVAFGNPKQEIWIHKHLSSLKVGGAMAVGGTFRYVAGLSKLPPKWMEKAGLEWLYRLFTEPYRVGRILNAFPIFPLKVFLYKLGI